MSAVGNRQEFFGREPEYTTVIEMLGYVRRHPLKIGSRSRILPVCIWGSRGSGKTAQIEAFCEQAGYQMKLYHPAHDVSGADIAGERFIDDSGRLAHALPDFLPGPEDEENGVIFIDEINRAPEAVLAGLMEPLGSGTLSKSGWVLPPGWQIVAAANPQTTDYGVQAMDSAMIDRMIHYNPGWEFPVWAAWANKNNLSRQLIEFAASYPEIIDSTTTLGEFQLPPAIEAALKCTPRTYTYMAFIYDQGAPERILRTIGYGLIGRPATERLISWLSEPRQIIPVEMIFGEPTSSIDPQTNAAVNSYEYDQYIAFWRRDPEKHRRGLVGTINLLVAELVHRQPDQMKQLEQEAIETRRSRDLFEKEQRLGDSSSAEISSSALADSVAGRSFEPAGPSQSAVAAGRFLALLPVDYRTDALEAVRRACPGWFKEIDAVTVNWLGYFTQTNQDLV